MRFEVSTIKEVAEQFLEKNKNGGFTRVSYAAFPTPDLESVAYYELRLEAPNRDKLTRPVHEASPGLWELEKPQVPYAPCGAADVAKAAIAGRIALAFWVEGPKKVQTLRAQGVPACSSGGASSASATTKCDFSKLRALDLTWIFWPDKDEPGLKHCWDAYQQLKPKTCLFMDPSQWPDVKGYDCVDAIANGWRYDSTRTDKTLTLEQFKALLPRSAQVQRPNKKTDTLDNVGKKTNKENEHWEIAIGWIAAQNGNLAYVDGLIWSWDPLGYWTPQLDEGALLSSIRQWSLAHGYSVGSNTKAISILAIATHELPKKVRPSDDRIIINCLSGQLEWNGETFDLKPHNKEDFCTNQIPHYFNKSPDSKIILRLFYNIFGVDNENPNDLVDELLEGFGMTLLQTPKFEKSYWLYGEGATGKSTVLYALECLLGAGNYTSRSLSSLTDKYSKLDLLNKYANIATELSAREIFEDGPLKALISGEPITADRKFKNSVQFKNKAIFWFASNNPPQIEDRTSALVRRLIVLPFRNKFKEDANLKIRADLRQEAPILFYMAVDAASKLLKRGRVLNYATSQETKDSLLRDSDLVRVFVHECFVKDSESRVSKEEFFQIYKRWADEQEINQRYRLNKNSLIKRCLQIGFGEGRSNSERYLTGYKTVLSRMLSMN